MLKKHDRRSLPTHWICAAAMLAALHGQGLAQSDLKPPQTPDNLKVPAGHDLFFKGFASGTQNYVCVPGPSAPAWKFLGPQATVFATLPWVPKPIRIQVMTHFLSANPAEAGLARPAWQSSNDTSIVWGKAIASSTDPQYVAPGAIPWLLVEIAGSGRGPANGDAMTQTTYIQRLNTSAGIAPVDGCTEAAYGQVALVPYTTDYLFYRPSRRR